MGRENEHHHFIADNLGRGYFSVAICLIAVAVIAASCLSVMESDDVSFADDSGSCGNGLTYTFTQSTHTLSIQKTGDGDGAMTEFGWKNAPWYNYADDILTITMGDGVTTICASAFIDCTSLKTVTIGKDVTAIGELAFRNCASISSIHIPDGMEHIGTAAFKDCKSLTSVNIPSGMKKIAEQMFENCASLASIHLPDGIETVLGYSFGGCTSLTSINIPSSVTFISSGAFAECPSLRTIAVDASNPNYLSDAQGILYNKAKTELMKCPYGVKAVDVPDSVDYIYSYAFYGCATLNSVNFGNGLREIGNFAFYGCSSLESLIIPDNVKQITESAFYGCTSLSSVVLGNEQTFISGKLFYGCSSLAYIDIPSSITTINSNAFIGDSYEIKFYEGDRAVEPTAENLAGKIWKGTGNQKLYHYTPGLLYTVDVSAGTGGSVSKPSVTATSGSVISADGNRLTIDGITVIAAPSQGYSFDRWDGLKATVTSDMGIAAIFTQSTQEYIVAVSAGAGGTVSQSSVIVPWGTSISSNGNILTIGNNTVTATPLQGYSFDRWDGLIATVTADLNIFATFKATTIIHSGDCGDSLYWSLNRDGELRIYGSGPMYDYGDSPAPWIDYSVSLYVLTLEPGLTSIGDNAFSECYGFGGSLIIPDGVTSIGAEAFRNCEHFTGSLVMPDGVTYIGAKAFSFCEGFTGSLTIPDSVTYIGSGAFSYCMGFSGRLILGGGPIAIEEGAFHSTHFNVISFGNGLESINPFAFSIDGRYRFYDNDGKKELSVSVFNMRGYHFVGIYTTQMIRQESLEYHHVSYDVNGGSEPAPVQADVVKGTKYYAAEYSGTKPGCFFGGWSYDGSILQPGNGIQIGSHDIVLSAIWYREGVFHTVSYEVGAGSEPAPSQSSVAEGKFFTVYPYSGTKQGNDFLGWSYNGKTYLPGERMVMGFEDIVLVAKWDSQFPTEILAIVIVVIVAAVAVAAVVIKRRNKRFLHTS